MKTNIVLAFRNIIKNRVNSCITVAGLSVAFACMLLIYLYVFQEFRYNNFHEKKDKIYRINYSVIMADGTEGSDVLLESVLSKILKEKIPYVIRSTAFRGASEPTLIFENINFEEKLCITESDFFSMFSFNLLAGNKDELFKNPDEIVITSKLAKKLQTVDSCRIEELLGGKVFFMNTGDQPFIITGIMEDVPENSSIQFDALIPYEYENRFSQSNNSLGNSTIFYEINDKDNRYLAEKEVIKIIKEHYKSLIDRLHNLKILAEMSDSFILSVSSLNNIYLDKITSDYERNNNKTSLYILSVIGFLISITACSNFIILSLGQSFNRTGEVGIRKALGAKKRDVFILFFTEGIILTIISVVLGTLLCSYLIPVFNQLAHNEIYTDLINIPWILVFTITCILLIVAFTSVVPITKLVNINPNVLVSKYLFTEKNKNITRIFVTLQYALSIFLIISTIAIIHQTNYMKKKYQGFSTEEIIALRINHLQSKDKLIIREKIQDFPGVVNLTITDRNYIQGRSSESIRNERGDNINTRLLKVDQNYLPTLNIRLIKGDNFNEGNVNETDHSIIVNEKFLSHFDFKDNAIGQIINMDETDFRIIGVVKDYHYDSMKEEIEPLVLYAKTNIGNSYNYILIKFLPSQLNKLITSMNDTWGNLFPDKELDYKFWNEQLNNRYESEERWSKIIGYTSIIAIIISSLGLFGLTLLFINKRVKEIGIRKINGARVGELMIMLNKNFLKSIIIAFVIASPIAYYTMNKWLENFAYKTELSWWIYVLAGLLALLIAVVTVSWQSWRVANRNPVEALRYE